jgi:hypothetical protein
MDLTENVLAFSVPSDLKISILAMMLDEVRVAEEEKVTCSVGISSLT